ncbi:MAG: SAM-dependent methyltransferase [Verrucomicrobia bacterium]|nr:MAG: SAM-dependent methyltransferase [Verrucomicrobiota bacterium]
MRRKKPFNAVPFEYHQDLDLNIQTLTNEGQGLGRIRLPDSEPESAGWVVLVPFALPGDRIRARVWRNHKNYSEADLLEVLEPSVDRVEPPCPVFGKCGGCQYQNLSYSKQLEWKRRQVAELLLHLAKIEAEVDPVIRSPEIYGYRSKITPHFERPRPDRELAIGFRAQGSFRGVVDVPRCLLATGAINERLAAVRQEVMRKRETYPRGATLLLRDAREGVTTDPKAIIHEKVGNLTLHFPAGEFFQNNPFILEAFTAHVRDEAVSGGNRFLIDAYCGSGLFCLTAARSFEESTGIEISEPSIRWARENAQANEIGNCSFEVGDAAGIFETVRYPPDETAVVIDPPRKGSTAEFLEQLIGFSPRTVIYVSCNPATQARDLAVLHQGGYAIGRIQPFDLFPQTRHLECVVTLKREG